MTIGSKELIRDMNRGLVLETIIKNKTISRASISKELGLTKATISVIVQELINKELVQEVGSDDTLLGRKPILISFHKESGYAAAIDIGVNTISVLVTDLAGSSKNLKKVRTPKVNDLVPSIIDLLTGMLKASSETRYGLVGIAIGIHGIVSDNKVIFTPYYNIKGIDIAKELSDNFSVPVYLENEANLSVIGEETHMSDTYTNIANLSIHAGVGLGLMFNHTLYSGNHGYAGEMGHTIIELNGKECPCGSKGCLEQYLSEQAILKEYATLSNILETDIDEFLIAYRQKEDSALQAAKHFTSYLSLCINNILNSLNPDIIIINCSLTASFPELIEQAVLNLSSRMNDMVPVLPSKLNDMSMLIGGISLIIKNFLKICNVSPTTLSE